MTTKGYVPMPREVMCAEWFDDGVTLKIYCYLLFNAAFTDTVYINTIIRKGEYAATVSRLANDLKLSSADVRKGIRHLTETNYITVNSNTKFSVYRINSLAGEKTSNVSAERSAAPVRVPTAKSAPTVPTQKQVPAYKNSSSGNSFTVDNVMARVMAQYKNK